MRRITSRNRQRTKLIGQAHTHLRILRPQFAQQIRLRSHPTSAVRAYSRARHPVRTWYLNARSSTAWHSSMLPIPWRTVARAPHAAQRATHLVDAREHNMALDHALRRQTPSGPSLNTRAPTRVPAVQ